MTWVLWLLLMVGLLLFGLMRWADYREGGWRKVCWETIVFVVMMIVVNLVVIALEAARDTWVEGAILGAIALAVLGIVVLTFANARRINENQKDMRPGS